MPLKLITAPAAEPVSLAEAKTHLRVEVADDDSLITAIITAARQAAEHELGRSLITQTWEQVLDTFPEAVRLPRGPVASITSVKYIDVDGTEQTLASAGYTLDEVSTPAWLVPAYGYTWPDTQDVPNAVRVRYAAGYGAAGSAVPSAIRQWMLAQIGHMYEHRESVNVGNIVMEMPYIDRLLDPYRIVEFG